MQERSDDPAPARLVEEELVREEHQERSLLKRNEGGMLKIRRLWFRKAPLHLILDLSLNTLWEFEQTSLRLGFLICRV